MSRGFLGKVADWVIPMHSNRRMLLRMIRDLSRDPAQLTHRLNRSNVGHFLKYRRRHFRCPICGSDATPLYDFPDIPLRKEHHIGVLRETLQCRVCLASMRQRSLAIALLEYLKARWAVRLDSIAEVAAHGLRGVRILDSDNFSAISQLLRRDESYVRLSYLPDQPWGAQLGPNYFNQDLQRLSFADESFDIALTSDVMEHVRDCDAAHRELFRVLSPGGAYIFTVPFDPDSEQHVQLVDTSSAEDVYLCKPHFHGDPLTGGVLAYRVFGSALVHDLAAVGFETQFEMLQRPEHLVVNGDVFVARKPSRPGSTSVLAAQTILIDV